MARSTSASLSLVRSKSSVSSRLFLRSASRSLMRKLEQLMALRKLVLRDQVFGA